MARMEIGSGPAVSATAAVCEVCGGPAVAEIAADGSWLVRCGGCGTVQYGLPGFPPPPISAAAVALGLDL